MSIVGNTRKNQHKKIQFMETEFPERKYYMPGVINASGKHIVYFKEEVQEILKTGKSRQVIDDVRSLSDTETKQARKQNIIKRLVEVVASIAAVLFLLVKPLYIPGQGIVFPTLASVGTLAECQDLQKELSFKTLCMEEKQK